MSDEGPVPSGAGPSAAGAARPERPPRRRGYRRAVGGTVPPAQGPPDRAARGSSRDETDEGWGDRPAPDDDDRLLRDVPPHWGPRA